VETKPLLDRSEIDQLEEHLQPDNTHKLVHSASHLLSDLTRFAGIVVAPRRRSPAFRHIEFLGLSEKRLLLIIVTPDGDVQNRILATDKTFTSAELTMAANFLNQNYAGLTFDDRGLLPAVVQDDADGTVLMVGFMDAEAVRRTLSSGRTWFWSRSRRRYWQKGETSGHVQHVRSVTADCDRDTLLVRVEQVGVACHLGSRSCFSAPLALAEGSS